MDTEQKAEVIFEEHSFYRMRQQLRKVSVEMYVGVATFSGLFCKLIAPNSNVRKRRQHNSACPSVTTVMF